MPLASTILEEVGTVYGLNWDDNSMLAIACQYIDRQKCNDAFSDFVVRFAENEIDEALAMRETTETSNGETNDGGNQ